MRGRAKRESKFPPLQFREDIFVCCLHPYAKQNNKIFVQTFRCAVAFWKSWVCKYSIRFQVIKLKHLCEILKNEKLLLNIQTKHGSIANKTLNVVIDAERTFKCKWLKFTFKKSWLENYLVKSQLKSLKIIKSLFYLV